MTGELGHFGFLPGRGWLPAFLISPVSEGLKTIPRCCDLLKGLTQLSSTHLLQSKKAKQSQQRTQEGGWGVRIPMEIGASFPAESHRTQSMSSTTHGGCHQSGALRRDAVTRIFIGDWSRR